MKAVKVYLSDDLLSSVDACAKDQGRGRSNLIRHAVKGYLSRYGYKPEEYALNVHAKGSEGNSEAGPA